MPNLLSIAVLHDEDRTLLTPSGELDLSTTPILEQALATALARGSRVELELKGLTFIDSSGLRLLIATNEKAHALRVDLLFHRPSLSVARIFDLAGLTGRLPMGDPAGRGPETGGTCDGPGSADRSSITPGASDGDRGRVVRRPQVGSPS